MNLSSYKIKNKKKIIDVFQLLFVKISKDKDMIYWWFFQHFRQ